MRFIVAVFRFFAAFAIVYGADWLMGYPIMWFIEWFRELSVFWSIVVALFGFVVIMTAISITGMINAFAVAFSPLKVLTAALVTIWMVVTSIMTIVVFVDIIDWGNTKSAILGVGLILYAAGRGFYGSIMTWTGIADDGSFPLAYKKPPKREYSQPDVLDSPQNTK